MKKLLLSLAVCLFALAVQAQKPVQGNLLTEANFNIATLNDNFTLPSLRFRYFIAEDMALRADVSIGGNKITQDFAENSDGTGTSGSSETKSSSFGVTVGAEKHFGGNKNFSPFMAAAVGFTSAGFDMSSTNSDGDVFVADYSQASDFSSSFFGVSVLVGGDYWIGESFYLGTEFGFGFQSGSIGDQTTTMTSGGTTTTTIEKGGKISGFGEGIVSGFRIGFILNK